MKRTKTQSISERNQWIHEFENLYILTYKSLYRHAKLIFGQEDKTKELLNSFRKRRVHWTGC